MAYRTHRRPLPLYPDPSPPSSTFERRREDRGGGPRAFSTFSPTVKDPRRSSHGSIDQKGEDRPVRRPLEDMSEDEITFRIDSCFIYFDKNSNGMVAPHLIGLMMRCVGYLCSHPEAVQLEKDFPYGIQKERFSGILKRRIEAMRKKAASKKTTQSKSQRGGGGGVSQSTRDELLNVFNTFDIKNCGSICVDHVQHVVTSIGEKMTDADFDLLFHLVKMPKPRYIDFYHFVYLLTGEFMD